MIFNRPAYLIMILLLLLLSWPGHSDELIQLPTRGICAHRGAMSSHPENTLAAFREAIRLGAHMIEFDVFMTADSELVVIHDPTVDRTTNGNGRVSEMTLEQIKSLDAGSWKSQRFRNERIPTLKEVLDMMPRNIWLNVHLKDSPEAGRRTALEIARQKRLHQAFLACDLETKRVAQLAVPGLMVCNMERQEQEQDYVDLTISNKTEFIQFYKTAPDAAGGFIHTLHKHNIRINYCCSDNPEIVGQLLSLGIDFVLVNDVAAAMTVAKKLGIPPVEPVYHIEGNR